MAHPAERRRQLRGLYVYKRLPMEAACRTLGVPRSTANTWKQQARSDGDDWDKARAAVALGDDNFLQLSKKLLEDYLVQHQATIDLLRETGAAQMPPQARAQLLAMLADSFHKTMASFRRLVPELSRHAVALDTLQRLASFTQQRWPQHVPVLLEILEPFSEELAKAYG